MKCQFRKDYRTTEECGAPAAFIWKALSGDLAICGGCASSPYIFLVDKLIPLTPAAERSPLLRGIAVNGGGF